MLYGMTLLEQHHLLEHLNTGNIGSANNVTRNGTGLESSR